MILFRRYLVLLLFVFLMGCGARIVIILPESEPTITPTTTSTSTAIPRVFATTLTNLNVRSGPGTNFVVVRVLVAGTRIEVVGRNLENTWLRVSDGWISSSPQLIQLSGSTTSLPYPTDEPTVTPTFTPLPTTIIDPTPTRENLANRVSYNINGLVAIDKPYLRQHLTALCPTTVLVMDNLEFAVELHNLLRSCSTLVVHRSYDIDEGSEWFREPVVEFTNQWRREGLPQLLRYSTNEPSYGGLQSVEQFIANSVELMREARRYGFTLVVGNFAVGTVRWEDVSQGKYDPFLRAINDYGHYLGLHEYSQTVLAFGVGQWPRECLLDPVCVRRENWPSADRLPTAFWQSPEWGTIWPPYWHLRRGDWFLLRADQLHISRPRIILSEFGWDSLADIKSSIEPLRRFGFPRYMYDLRGVNTYQGLWAFYWPQWSFGRAACEQIIWADSIYPSDYIGFQLFTWSVHPHWLHTDFSGVENPSLFDLHRCLEDYGRSS